MMRCDESHETAHTSRIDTPNHPLSRHHTRNQSIYISLLLNARRHSHYVTITMLKWLKRCAGWHCSCIFIILITALSLLLLLYSCSPLPFPHFTPLADLSFHSFLSSLFVILLPFTSSSPSFFHFSSHHFLHLSSHHSHSFNTFCQSSFSITVLSFPYSSSFPSSQYPSPHTHTHPPYLFVLVFPLPPIHPPSVLVSFSVTVYPSTEFSLSSSS